MIKSRKKHLPKNSRGFAAETIEFSGISPYICAFAPCRTKTPAAQPLWAACISMFPSILFLNFINISQDSQNNNRIYYARKQAAHDHPFRIRQTVLTGRAGKAITYRYGRTGIYQKIPMQSLGVHEAGIAANASIFPRSFIKIFTN